MNKVITDGLVLMPPAFADGLDVWSSGDGTPGSDTYAGSGNGVFVPADQNFAGCLEVVKTQSVTKVRYMGETPILPGCYLQITARVKVLSGALPGVRIAGWAGTAGGSNLNGVVQTGPGVSIDSYGEVVEVKAIVGTGSRTGVDMVWAGASYGHFGLDLTGPNGAVVRIDDFTIEDVTGVFLRDMMGVVDVRDYGAVGDGVTDDYLAFEAADNDANGRVVLVSAGTYFLGNNVTIQNQIRFEGTVTMAEEHRLIFQKNFDYATYVDAFVDEELAFKKAFQALLNFSDHDSLDLCGRRISLSGPVDMQAALNNKTIFEVRRVIRNGQIQPIPGPNWDTDVVVAQGTYSANDPYRLTNVANINSIQPGSLVSGNGVGREVYATSVNVAQSSVTLSAQLFDAQGTQPFTFTRFKYMLDFSGFEKLSDMILHDMEFRCEGEASAVMIPPDGLLFQVRDCHFLRPKDRCITSTGEGCQGMIIDRCNFVSDEQATPAQNRKSICFNVNANDPKIRNSRAVRFRHFCVLQGNGNLITGNHWFNGDNETNAVRMAGMILTSPNCLTTITGNYIDNNFIEWTNEHDATPDSNNDLSFGGLTITGNIFVVIFVQSSFNWLVVKPVGQGHAIAGLSVIGNVFRTYNAQIDRIERVDTTYADLDFNRMRNITFAANAFNGVTEQVRNPYVDVHNQESEDASWTIGTNGYLPFGGWARTIESVVPVQAIRNTANDVVFAQPYVDPVNGANTDEFRVIWPEPVRGQVRFSVRMDNPA